MKVLHVIDRLEVGGAEKVFVGLTQLLAEHGITTGALVFSAGSPLDKQLDKKVKLHILNRKNKYSIRILRKAHRICKNYDIVHVHLRHVYAYMRLAQWLFGGKYKLIIHDHAGVANGIPKRFKGILKPKYYIGVNKQQIDWAVNTIGVPESSVYLLENTILPTNKAITQPCTDNKAMMVANIRKVKNIDFAIELCKKMNWSLDVYGNVLDHDYYTYLMSQTSESIKIKTGVIDFSDIYPSHKLAVHCSHEETGPLVLIEYLSVGLPFIAYQTGSAADAIAEELPQLFIQNFDANAWEQRIKEITADETLPSKMRTVYASKFNPEDYINKCLNIYKNVHS